METVTIPKTEYEKLQREHYELINRQQCHPVCPCYHVPHGGDCPWCRLLDAAKEACYATSKSCSCSMCDTARPLREAIKALDPEWEG